VVGQVQRSDPLLLSGTFDPGEGTPLLLADGVDAATTIETFAVFQRSYGWVAGLDLDRLGADGVAQWVRRSAAVHDALWLDREGLFLTTPDGVLRAEDARARTSGRRFAVLGSATARNAKLAELPGFLVGDVDAVAAEGEAFETFVARFLAPWHRQRPQVMRAIKWQAAARKRWTAEPALRP